MNAGEVITAFGADISNFISGLNRMSSQGSPTAAGSGSGRGRPIIIKFIVNGREFVQSIGTDLADEIILQLGGQH